MDVRFIEFNEIFLELSFRWLTNKEIKILTMTPDITQTGQREWYEGLNSRSDYMVRGVLVENCPVGVVGLKHIDVQEKVAEYFGYIGEKDYWGKGIGHLMMQFIESEASKMGLQKLKLNVLKINERALHLYEKNGYTSIFESDDIIYMEKRIK